MSASVWSQKYDAVKRQILSRRAMGQIFTAEEVQDISNIVNDLDRQLQTMSQAPMEYQLYASELARRRLVLDNLKNNLPRLPRTNPIPSSGSKPSTSQSSNNNTFNPTSDKGLVQRQKEIMKLQDEMIGEIGDGVDRLHRQAIGIGDEAKIHVRLLDDLDTNVGHATTALQAESAHAERIKESSRICYMYICIVIEVLLIVLLLVIAFK